MNYKKIIAFFFVVFLASFSISYFFQEATERKIAEEKKENYLRGVEIEKIKLVKEGGQYSLGSGKVLKEGVVEENKEIKDKVMGLSLFYKWTEEDPLFVAPGFEGKKLAAVLKKYDEKKNIIEKATGFKKDIMPVKFLAILPEVEKKQSEFLSDINEENAKKLVAVYEEANKIYYEEAAEFKKNIKEKGLGNVFVLLSGLTTDKDLILKDIDIMFKNSEGLREEIKKREECLSGKIESCERTGLSFQKPTQEKENEISQEIKLLAKDELFYLSEARDKFENGPYEIETECLKPMSPESGKRQYVYVTKEETPVFPETVYKTVKAATNNFYASQYNGDYQRFFNKEIKWTPIPDANPYTCSDFTYIPEAVTMDKFYKKYREDWLYKKMKELKKDWPEEIRQLLQEGEVFENNFFDEKFPSQRRLKELSEFYAYTYSYLNLNKIEELDSYREELLNRYLVIDRKMADFELVMENFFFNIIDYYKNLYVKSESFEEGYLYSLRTAYSLSYLPFSSSVWRIEEKLKYYERFTRGDNGDFMDYNKALESYNKEDIKKWKKDLLDIFYEYDRRFKSDPNVRITSE